jgi:hypothetical protein
LGVALLVGLCNAFSSTIFLDRCINMIMSHSLFKLLLAPISNMSIRIKVEEQNGGYNQRKGGKNFTGSIHRNSELVFSLAFTGEKLKGNSQGK